MNSCANWVTVTPWYFFLYMCESGGANNSYIFIQSQLWLKKHKGRRSEQSTWVVVGFLFVLLCWTTNIRVPGKINTLGRTGSAGRVWLQIFRCLIEELVSAPLVSPCVLMKTWKQTSSENQIRQGRSFNQVWSWNTYNVLVCSLIPFSETNKQIICSRQNSALRKQRNSGGLSASGPNYLLWGFSWSGFSHRARWQRQGPPPPPQWQWRASKVRRKRWPSSSRSKRM